MLLPEERDRKPRGIEDLEGSYRPIEIMGMDFRGCARIDFAQSLIEKCFAFLLASCFNFFTEIDSRLVKRPGPAL
jgi:hypothetical protein